MSVRAFGLTLRSDEAMSSLSESGPDALNGGWVQVNAKSIAVAVQPYACNFSLHTQQPLRRYPAEAQRSAIELKLTSVVYTR